MGNIFPRQPGKLPLLFFDVKQPGDRLRARPEAQGSDMLSLSSLEGLDTQSDIPASLQDKVQGRAR